ncbi:cytochrome P450 [Mycolicibacterium sp.]|uniref:cytochrome P450 n=1 Tax=Mycolicibacterium sp. TaxID=2320850 RepID=UPI0037CB9B0F
MPHPSASVNANDFTLAARCPHLAQQFDPLMPDPFPVLEALREEAPVFYDAEHQAWFVTRHEDVMRIYGDLDTFSNAGIYPTRVPIPDVIAAKVGADYRFPTDKHLNSMDEPDHTRVRRLMSKAFTARRVKEREPEIRALANGLIDGFENDGKVDLLARFTSPIPTGVVAMLLGTTQEVGLRFRGWVDDIFSLTGQLDLPEEVAIKHWNGLIECERWARDLIADHRENPREDFTSFMIEAESDDGSPSLSDDELLQQILSVLLAGSDTSSVLIAETLHRLLAVPERWQAVIDDPALIPAVIEEALRLGSPVRGLHRTVTRDVELGGVLIPAGADLYFMHKSANRDAKVFTDPNAFNPARSEIKQHVGMGAGARFCLGAPLARLEARVAVETLTTRIPDLRLAADQGELEYDINMIVPILHALNAEWTPRS